MIDFHSHILPGMDDGSRSMEESLQLLQKLQEQGVDILVATPHFYGDRETPESFLARRREVLDRLRQGIPEGMRLLAGAEVRYYEGLGRLPQLPDLCMEDTDILLLEMPEQRWTEHMIGELLHMAGRLRLMIAHVERVVAFQKKDTLARLAQRGVLFQGNAGFFLGRLSRHRAFRMLEEGRLHVLGSDCHNMTTRPPRLAEARQKIARRFGPEFVEQMDRFACALLCGAE